MSGKILIAIHDELDKARAPDGVRVIYTGIGKINAASATTLAPLTQRPGARHQLRHRRKDQRDASGVVECPASSSAT